MIIQEPLRAYMTGNDAYQKIQGEGHCVTHMTN